MNGRRLPLCWASQVRKAGSHANTYILLDVAALVTTTSLDLSNPNTAPDFLTMPFYKMYGFPDLGALAVRRSAAYLFDKKRYFGGGTTESITCDDGEKAWVARKDSLRARLEDGTLPMHSILALKCAVGVHQRLYGGFGEVSQHTSWLAKQLFEQLASLRHENGRPVCTIYKDQASDYGNAETQGAVLALNIVDSSGVYHGKWDSSALGGLCNPGGMAQALGLHADDIRSAFDAGYRCGQDPDTTQRPFGVVRVSVGACSTLHDRREMAMVGAEMFEKMEDVVQPCMRAKHFERHGNIEPNF
ncbi:hypothetical protein DM02DRAFT_647482 [Periconia macrospinosa]|uniref:Aminotransferase class V domain-containing protein n=1 Tax=Periconia macrospinosa TaxID=97972 RepID=A0A2V1CYP6_9PLEO|nr:hypothetical protein DM02DRAFT_647482 [Periconia macrospinosa]